ncbi:MAG: hypothetical protein OXT74_02095 [Candidatus Poribacteria bacterium]|nr:hypothetical protein [Candidatus Poribacteria bacterium]
MRDGNYEIYVMDSNGGNQVNLTDDPATDWSPTWSPDGDRIAFVSSRGTYSSIYTMDSDGRNVMQLTGASNVSDPAWSPDGVKIAFTRPNGGKIQVWVMDADGGNPVQLTHIGSNHFPAWSPSGNRLAFVTFKRHEGAEIYVIDRNGNHEQRLTQDVATKTFPSWSPDGQLIAYSGLRNEVFQIYAVRTDGSGQTERLTHNLPNKSNPAWSPDGGMISYTSWSTGVPATIHLMTPDGQHLKQLSEERGYDFETDWFDPVAPRVSPAANYLTIWGKVKQPTLDLR